MEDREIKKIQKGRSYTYEELKDIYKDAMAKTAANPTGDSKKAKEDAQFQFSMMLSSMVILSEMEKNLFEKDSSEE